MLMTARPVRASDDDPFALPPAMMNRLAADDGSCTGAAAHGCSTTLIADLVIDDEALPDPVHLLRDGDRLSILTRNAIDAGLLARPPATDFVALDQIAGIDFAFDAAANRLTITHAQRTGNGRLIDLRAGAAGRRITPLRNGAVPITALIVDYDINLDIAAQRSSAAGLVGARLVRDTVVLRGDWRMATDHAVGQDAIVRLDTTLKISAPRSLTQTSIGDFVSIGTGSSRAVRMGGLQIATDFSQRPDLVTYPLPDFAGNVAVPSGLDLIVNDRRLSQEELKPGEFTLRNIPVPVGSSQIGVVLRDALGREQVRSIRFYSSPDQLAPGLVQAALNIGAIRRGYGIDSHDYRDMALSAMVRRGLTQTLTAQGALELADHFTSGGIGASLTVGALGLFSMDARASRYRPPSGDQRHGNMVTARLESRAQRVSLALEARHVSPGYDDLASTQGDLPPTSLLSGNISFNLGDYGAITLAAIRQAGQATGVARRIANDRATQVVALSYRNRLKRSINLFVDFSRRRTDISGHSLNLLLGLSFQFAGRSTAQSSLSVQDGARQGEAAVYRPDYLPGDIGYNLQAGTGLVDRVAGGVSYRGGWGRVEAQGENVAGSTAFRLGARGSLIATGGDMFAVDTGANAFVLVDSGGVSGVPVLYENRQAGLTGRSGRKLLTNITPNVPVRIGIDPDALPINVNAHSLGQTVQVQAGSVARFDLRIDRYQPLRFRIMDGNGDPLAPGTILRAMPSGTEYLVGFDARVEINGSLSDRQLRAWFPDGTSCTLAMPAATDHDVARCSGQHHGTSVMASSAFP